MPVVASEYSIVWSAIQSAVARIAPQKSRKTTGTGAPAETTKSSSFKNKTKKAVTSSSPPPKRHVAPTSASASAAVVGASTSKAQADKKSSSSGSNVKKSNHAEEDGLDLLSSGKDEEEQLAAIVSPLVNSGAITAAAGVFVEEAVRGILKYMPFLDLTLDTFTEIRRRNRSHNPALRIFLYLALFRLDELGSKFVHLFCSIPTNNSSGSSSTGDAVVASAAGTGMSVVPETKALELLQTLSDDELREKHYEKKWKTLYDDVFVDKVIVDRHIKQQQQWRPLLSYYRKMATLADASISRATAAAAASSLSQSPDKSSQQQQRQPRVSIVDAFGPMYADAAAGRAGANVHDDDDDDDDDPRAAQLRAYEKRLMMMGQQQQQPSSSSTAAGKNTNNNGSAAGAPPPPAKSIYAHRFSQQLNRQSDGAISSEIRQMEALRDPLNYPERHKELEYRFTEPPPEAVAAMKEVAKGNRFPSLLAEEARTANRQREEAARVEVREFVPTERPMQMPRLLAEAAEREARERKPVRSAPMPASSAGGGGRQSSAPAVRSTHAALMREAALYKKQEEREKEKLAQAERELRGTEDFESWRNAQHADAERAKQQAVRARKLEMQLIEEQAIEAKKQLQAQNQEHTRHMREQEKEVLRKLHEEKECQAEQNRDRAADIRVELELRRAEALESLEQAKLRAAAAVKADAERGQKEIAVRLELERQRRAELTEQLKRAHTAFCAKKRAANEAAKELELKELRALTIDQVQEMIARVKDEEREWLEAQRHKIVAAKEQEAAKLRQLEEQISRSRNRIVQDKVTVRTEKQTAKMAEDEQRRAMEDERILQLQARLQEKRETRMKERNDVRAADKQRKVAALLLEADEAHVEAKRWSELEGAMQRRSVQSQRTGVKESIKSARLHDREDQLRQSNIDQKLVADFDQRKKQDNAWDSKLQQRMALDDETLLQVHRTVQFESQLQRQRRAHAALQTSQRDFSKIM